MSTVSNNKKFLNLDGVRVYYNRKDDTIQISSTDEDMAGEPFKITLKQGTESEVTLRNLLREKEIISEEDYAGKVSIPKFIKYPMNGNLSDAWNLIPLGVGEKSEPILWNVNLVAHAFIGGRPGSGKSVLQRNLFLHTVLHPESWRFMGIDLKKIEMSSYAKFENTILEIATSLDAALELLRTLNKTLKVRYEKMEKAGVNHFRDLKDDNGKPPHAIMMMVDEAYLLLAEDGRNSYGENLKNAPLRTEAKTIISDLARFGRAAGIHLVLATFYPDRSVIPKELSDNLDLRVSVGTNDDLATTSLLGKPYIFNSKSADITGRSYINSFGIVDSRNSPIGFEITEFQPYYSTSTLDDETIHLS